MVAFSHKNHFGEILWECLCDCGQSKKVKAGILRKGESQSCGCLWREKITSHGMTKTRTFKSWESMLQRCTNENDPSYSRYGGMGVSVCPAWRDFATFFADMGERPEGMSIDRYPNQAGNYEPGNCRWASAREQQRNRKISKTLTVDGVTKPLIEWAYWSGIEYSTLLRRLHSGWAHKDIVSKPSRKERT